MFFCIPKSCWNYIPFFPLKISLYFNCWWYLECFIVWNQSKKSGYHPVIKHGNGKWPISRWIHIQTSNHRGFSSAMFDYQRVVESASQICHQIDVSSKSGPHFLGSFEFHVNACRTSSRYHPAMKTCNEHCNHSMQRDWYQCPWLGTSRQMPLGNNEQVRIKDHLLSDQREQKHGKNTMCNWRTH